MVNQLQAIRRCHGNRHAGVTAAFQASVSHLAERDAARNPGGKHRAHIALSLPNQLWCWDITWLPGSACGLFYYLYLIMDLYSRKIVAWEVHETEASDLAAGLARRACLSEGIAARPLVLHSDNGAR